MHRDRLFGPGIGRPGGAHLVGARALQIVEHDVVEGQPDIGEFGIGERAGRAFDVADDVERWAGASGVGWSRVSSSRVGASGTVWASPGEAVNSALVDSAATPIHARKNAIAPCTIPPLRTRNSIESDEQLA